MSVPATETESQLRRWFVHEDIYLSAFTRQWLERTPPDEAADLLAHIAQDAQLEGLSLLALLARSFALAGFSPSLAIAGGGVYARKAGIRAALLLASLNDARALTPLARLWSVNPLNQSKYHDKIEWSLVVLLSDDFTPDELRLHVPAVADLARRVWNVGLPRRDLTPQRAALIRAALTSVARTDANAAHSLADFLTATPSPRKTRAALQTDAATLTESSQLDTPPPSA